MPQFLTGLVVGGAITLVILVAIGSTPLDTQQKLCAEADWKLPSCIAMIDKAVSSAKGK